MILPRELEAVLEGVPLVAPEQARARLVDLAGAPAETIALCEVADTLADALAATADPDAALVQLDRFVGARGARLQLYGLFREHPGAFDALVRAIGASAYLADVLVRNPEYFVLLTEHDTLATPRPGANLAEELASVCSAFQTRDAKLDAVRRLRRRELLRIGAADLLGLLSFEQVAGELASLADAVVEQVLRVVVAGDDGGLFVLALGKLGGGELNYSSDIDLVLLTPDAARAGSAARAALDLTQALGAFTSEGFLYRVDLRLRPWGSAGGLVATTEVFARYLAEKAYPAERQAMLRARAIAGDRAQGAALLERTASLLWADAASARGNVRALKARIEKHAGADGRDVKLGPGGIRDVEFLVQAEQLASGPSGLACGNTLEGLERLVAAGRIARSDADVLAGSYRFLRTVEHRMQLMNNRQVHHLPSDAHGLLVLGRTLGFADAASFGAEYAERQRVVRAIYDRMLGDGHGA